MESSNWKSHQNNENVFVLERICCWWLIWSSRSSLETSDQACLLNTCTSHRSLLQCWTVGDRPQSLPGYICPLCGRENCSGVPGSDQSVHIPHLLSSGCWFGLWIPICNLKIYFQTVCLSNIAYWRKTSS